MASKTVEEMKQALKLIKPYMSISQYQGLVLCCAGEEKECFEDKISELCTLISNMPATYEQDGKGDDALVTLHYFYGGSDWYIIEKDMYGGVNQAYGYAILNGDVDMAECGYISIKELVSMRVELDLHFKPCTLAEVKSKHSPMHNIH